MKKSIVILTVLAFVLLFTGCKQTGEKIDGQSIKLLKVNLEGANLISDHKIEIDAMPQILSVEANVEIKKATVEVSSLASAPNKYEPECSGKIFRQSIEGFKKGENELKIIVEAKNGGMTEFSKLIIYTPRKLNAVVYIDEKYNKVKNQEQLITIKNDEARVFVVASHPLISATLDNGSVHKMTIDETSSKTASYVLTLSSTEKTINIKAMAKGYHEFSISFRLVKGVPPVHILKATFNNSEFYFDAKNEAIIHNPEIKFNSGKLELEFNEEEDLKVDVLSSTHGYVEEVVEGSGLKGDPGKRRQLKFIEGKKYTLELITLGKETQVKLKASAKDCVESIYTIKINRQEKQAFPTSSAYTARNAYSNQESALTDKGFVWPYVSDDKDAVYLYKIMGNLIATNFEFADNMKYYLFTRLKDKSEGEKKDGGWVKWGPSRYIDEWQESILNVRLSSQDKTEFYLDGFIGTEVYEAVFMVSALFKSLARGGLVLDAYSIVNENIGKNMAFARSQRFYKNMVHAFDEKNQNGLKIIARDSSLTAPHDYFVGYWTSTKEIETVECMISEQDKGEDVPTIVDGWNRVKVKCVPATETDFARIHFTLQEADTLEKRFVFKSAKIYTIDLFIKVKGEDEEIKGKYVISYKYN